MDADRRKIALNKKFVQFCCSTDTFYKNDHLVEIQGIKEVIQLAVLLKLTQLDIMLKGKGKNKNN